MIPFPLVLEGKKSKPPITLVAIGIIPPLALIVRGYLDAATEIAWGREGEGIFPNSRTYFLGDALGLAERHAREDDRTRLSSILKQISGWAAAISPFPSYQSLCATEGKILPQFFAGIFHSTLRHKTADSCLTVLDFLIDETYSEKQDSKEVIIFLRDIIREAVDGGMGEDWTDGIYNEGGEEAGIDLEVFGTNPLIESARHLNLRIFKEAVLSIDLGGMGVLEIEVAVEVINGAGKEYVDAMRYILDSSEMAERRRTPIRRILQLIDGIGK